LSLTPWIITVVEFRENVLPSDCEAVRWLATATGMFRLNEIDVAVELVQERLRLGAASGYHFVFAESGRKTIGYVCYGPITVTLHSYDLYWIVVDPSCQGQGVGRLLLEQAERRIAEMGGRQIYIETSGQAIYAPTQRFYDRCGYELTATIRDFYAPGDDKLIYVRKTA
jgi:ribosomal protein S18 acetylase RimI-like enzyme